MLVLEITGIYNETGLSKTFTFHASSDLKYEAGQFLTFIFEIRGTEIRRSYSFSSSPDTGEPPSVTIKLTTNGEISRWWFYEAKVGDKLRALSPAGMFSLAWQAAPRDIFLAAAGSGITPLYSILKSAIQKEPQSHIVLLYSNRNEQSTIFISQLKKVQEEYHDRLTIVWLFSNNKDLLHARLSTYNLQRIVSATIRYNKANAMMYACGPYDYMQTVQITWMTMGFPKNSFRKELFDINALPPLTRRYYDKKDRTISVLYKGTAVPIFVPYNETILDAALKKGIDIPYSCKAGKCSTCKCRVISGKVWMHYNEVLLDEDEAAGFALTCTGHPASEDVAIEI